MSGEVFRPGESLQVGWMYDLIVDRPDGTLGIQEPDFEQVPLAWVESATKTLRHIWFQKEVAASVALDPEFPSYRQRAIVCTRLRDTSVLFMHRETPADADSGWFIGCYDDDHDHNDVSQLVSVSLFEAAVAWDQRFIAYAALLPGCYVVAGQGPPVTIIVNGIVPDQGDPYLEEFRLNSADIDGNLAVDLTDIREFARDFYGTYAYRSDFVWDGMVNLSDLAALAPVFGAACP